MASPPGGGWQVNARFTVDAGGDAGAAAGGQRPSLPTCDTRLLDGRGHAL